MKKIMFNDKFGLTKAVIKGRKTQTRRIVPESIIDAYDEWRSDVECIAKPPGSTIETLDNYLLRKSRFYIGEVVAVAQNYKSVYNEQGLETMDMLVQNMKNRAGWNNKMFVCANLMPYQIRITNVRIERLQDISDEDCLRDGITDMGEGGSLRYSFAENIKQTTGDIIAFSNNFATAKESFACLIDKMSGKGTWESNPYVWVYDFELIK